MMAIRPRVSVMRHSPMSMPSRLTSMLGSFAAPRSHDPGHLLEGTGKFMRHVKLRPDRAVDATALSDSHRKFIHGYAAATEGRVVRGGFLPRSTLAFADFGSRFRGIRSTLTRFLLGTSIRASRENGSTPHSQRMMP